MKFKLFAFIILLIMLGGCVSNPSTDEIQPSSTSRLQITYIQLKEDQNYSKLYVMDITCMSADKICFDEPKLLFQSLKMPSNEQNLPKGLLTDYSWSPDGNKIALVSVGDILIGDMNTQNWTNITNSPDVDESELSWSPDGQFIFYLACPRIMEGNYGGHGKCHLYRSSPSGNDELGLLRAITYSIDSYDVSPDEQKIVFAISGQFPISNLLYQANLDGTDSHQMTMGNISENTPSFSPDGQKTIFTRSTTQYYVDRSDIVVKDLISGKEKNLTENFDGLAFSPMFSPDGEWILFDSFDTGLNANIFLAPLEQGDIIQVTQGNEEISPAWRKLSE